MRTAPAQLPATLGATVMATGIVSVDLHDHGIKAVSQVLMWIAVTLWALLVLAVGAVRWTDLRRELRSPQSLTIVAASTVLGTRLTDAGARWAGAALLAVAVVSWLPLTVAPLRSLPPRLPGSGFLLTVASAGIAVLSATLAASYHADWLLGVAAAFVLTGCALYLLVLPRFELGELLRGAGDHWVAGGALAIVALALAETATAGRGHGWSSAVATAAVVGWVAAMAWLPVLVATEIIRPRLRYDTRRWATVFPVGMYAAMSFAVDRAHPYAAIARFASGWTWAGLALWLAVAAATVTGLRRLSAVP